MMNYCSLLWGWINTKGSKLRVSVIYNPVLAKKNTCLFIANNFYIFTDNSSYKYSSNMQEMVYKSNKEITLSFSYISITHAIIV